MTDLNQKALDLHKQLKGKIEIRNKMDVDSLEIMSLLYSPGVAQPCVEIQNNPQSIYETTWKSNTVAVVSNGSAVLGLGDIGASAGLPVMEGKAMLFKAFSNVNAVPIMLDTKDPDEIIRAVEMMAPTFGGINLEDIKAPECVYIEKQLQKRLNIPVFHDDQHGTAIVVMAGLINAFKLIGKELKEAKVVVSGTGAAGSSIIHMLSEAGISNIYAYNVNGPVDKTKKDSYDFVVQGICECISDLNEEKTLSDLLKNADVFIGVSAPDIVSEEDIRSMNHDAVVFAMANPNPEITYEKAKRAGARIVGTGRSDYPNQVNNVLAFPGIFQGALSVRATEINEAMKLAAAYGIQSVLSEDELNDENIIPSALNPEVSRNVAQAVAQKAIEMGVILK
ncbi:malate dehydrogenase [Erysipelothrix larvae]|uniref:Malate dehydrogenase n=1 Tax=Erysipelothrix larvae TaxID=1514105 RepID=A0A0X8H0Q8_9FIRM|nr:NADP-dependent malic enzyme [Erysipelothrix larvae]AMC93954.1 malate dehydrogenase [Erysipelothrix larvae]